MNAQPESNTRLRGKWLLIARLVWAAMFITLTVMYVLSFFAVRDVLSTVCEEELCTLRQQIRRTDAGERVEIWTGPPIGFADRLRSDQVEALKMLGLTLDQYGQLAALQMGIPALAYLMIAAGLFWLKSDNWMALFASITIATFPLPNMPLPFTLGVRQPAWAWIVDLCSLVALLGFLTLPLLFPNGRFVPRWTRWMVCFELAWAVTVTLFRNSFLEIPRAINFVEIFIVISFGAGVYAQTYRYFRVASSVERQQIKWVVVGLTGFIFTSFLGLLPLNELLTSQAASMDPALALLLSVIPDILFQAILLFIPISIAISVLRYRLWDVDILINRSLVYFTLIAVTTGLYVLVVGSLSNLLQNQNDLAAPLVALLIVAAFAQPLHRALQNNVNRLLLFDPGRRDESESLQRSSEQPDKAQEKHIQIQVITKEDSSPHTRLHGRWLFSARAVWVAVVILAVIMHIAAAPVAFHVLATPCNFEPCMSPFQPGPDAEVTPQKLTSLKFGAWYHTILEAVLRLLTLGVALFIFWRLSDDWMAYLTSIMLVTVFAVFSPSPILLANDQPLWYWPRALVWAIGLASTVGLFYLFPDGRFVPRWTRGLAIVLLVIIGALAAAGAPFLSGFPIFVVALVTGAGFQIYRYRRVSGPFQRQQTKWVVLGIIGMVLPMLVFFLIAFLNPSLNPLLGPDSLSPQDEDIFSVMLTLCLVIPLCFLPVTLAFSLLRYRLWDVDLVINRTLVYGALTTSVVALYVFIVGWSSIGLQTQNNLAGSVFAVLVIAFLFRPLRQRLQRIVDRLVPVPQTAVPAEQHTHQIAIPEGQSAADTRLRGRWLLLARLAWATMFLTLTAMYALGFLAVRDVLSTVCDEEPCTLGQQIRHTEAGDQIMGFLGPPIGYADRLRSDQVKVLETLNLTLDRYGWLGALQMGIPLLICLLIAAGLFWRKSDDWMVVFVSTMIMTFPLPEMPLPYTLAVRQPIWQWVYVPATFVAVSAFFIFPLIFPTGRFVPRWMRWKMFFDIAFAIIVTLLLMNSVRFSENLAGGFVLAYLILSYVTNASAQSYRYFRVASPVERQQIKWVVAGLVGFLSIAFPMDTFLFYHPVVIDSAWALVLSAIPDTIYRAVALFIPVSIAISVLRYRLWDIDILINRTLVYGALTGIVVGAFVILVGFLSILFQSSGNSIIAIVATGLVALLFNPLRQRLQRGINHLMYGERDDPYVALSRLGRRLESTLAPESVLPTVVTTVRDVLKLPYVAIYLQQDSHGYKIVAESASPSLRIENGRIRVPGMEREGRCIPLIHQGERVGYIVLGPRAPNEAFSSTDLHLLDDLAPQVGVAVHAVRLTADLQRSREQLVLAREEERRRLRRDLHDDLAPTLASLGLTASTVADLISTNPTTATKLVRELQTEIRATVGNIRRLVYDLRPPTLDELGLLAAVRERAAQYTNAPGGVHITVDAPPELPALAAAVEVAAYRIVQEALENVSKHSHAQQCAIRFTNHNGLEIEIMDDGIGLPQNVTPGVGLRSMRERAEELGGSCVIERRANSGTRVLACLPIGEFNGTFAHPDRG